MFVCGLNNRICAPPSKKLERLCRLVALLNWMEFRFGRVAAAGSDAAFNRQHERVKRCRNALHAELRSLN